MAKVRIWDLPLRLFHWALVLLVGASFVTGQFSAALGLRAAAWHQWSGYAVLALLIFRVGWGFVGGSHARFSSFVRGPRAVLSTLRELAGRRRATPHVGHNPLGGWSVLAMLACLAVQASSGLFLADEDLGVEGPLAKYVGAQAMDTLKAVHESNVLVLLGLVALHIAAIAYYFIAKRENLVKPMLTGSKDLPPEQAAAAARGGHPVLAIAVLALAAGTVWSIANA